MQSAAQEAHDGTTLSTDELAWLHQRAGDRKNTKYAQVGVSEGEAFDFLARNCLRISSMYWVDAWEDEVQFQRLQARFRGWLVRERNVHLVRGTSPDGYLDMIFLTTGHTGEELLADIGAWWPRLSKDGVFCGHDFHLPGVRTALEYFTRTRHLYLVNPVGSIWRIFEAPG